MFKELAYVMIAIAWFCFCFVVMFKTIGTHEELTSIEKRNIAIDFIAQNPSWKYTLCTMPMDSKSKK